MHKTKFMYLFFFSFFFSLLFLIILIFYRFQSWDSAVWGLVEPTMLLFLKRMAYLLLSMHSVKESLFLIQLMFMEPMLTKFWWERYKDISLHPCISIFFYRFGTILPCCIKPIYKSEQNRLIAFVGG